MAVQENLAPLPQSNSPIDHLQSDPNVLVPKHIRDQAAAAEALHKQVYEAPQPELEPAPQPEPAPAP